MTDEQHEQYQQTIAELRDHLEHVTNIHHRTAIGSILHEPRVRGWRDCQCLTCMQSARLCPPHQPKPSSGE